MNKRVLKRAITVFALVFFILTMLGINFSAAAGADAVKKKILIVSPHEDDESIACAGIIKSAVDRGDDVKVMYISDGDLGGPPEQRAREVVAAMARLALSNDNLYYLGYADSIVLYQLYISKDDPLRVVNGSNGNQTLGFSDSLEDYHYMRFGTHAYYNRQNLLGDIQDIINNCRPDDIYMPSAFELHTDHKAASLFTTEAILNIKKNADYSPVIHEYMVYKYGLPQSGVNYDAPPVPYTDDTANMEYTSPYNWADRESVAVPAEMSILPTYLQKIDLTGAQITADDPCGPDYDISKAFDSDYESGYISTQTEGKTRITISFPKQENIERMNILTLDNPVSTFITVEAADTQGDLDGKTGSYVSLAQDLESKESDWVRITANAAGNLKIWRFTFHSNADYNVSKVRLIEFYNGNMKAATLRDYACQTGIEKWAMADEIFWKKTLSSLSYNAVATASSEDYFKQQFCSNVTDGVVLGDGMYKDRNDAYVQDPTRTYNYEYNKMNEPFEWAAMGETKKVWIQLSWVDPVTANRIVLYDRPDLDENILNAKLIFSEGPPVNVGSLNKNGSGTVIDFKSRTFTWVKLEIEKAEGTSTGLAEFEVYNMPNGADSCQN